MEGKNAEEGRERIRGEGIGYGFEENYLYASIKFSVKKDYFQNTFRVHSKMEIMRSPVPSMPMYVDNHLHFQHSSLKWYLCYDGKLC